MTESERFHAAIDAFDAENSEDPNLLDVGGKQRPRELVRALSLSRWVERLEPDASEALRLAARCQHIRRWEVPRNEYDAGRTGYLKWRKDLSRRHAEIATRVLQRVGYDEATIERVRAINMKKAMSQDPDVQTMEDALCLSFIENELDDFAGKHEEDKVVDIIRKTWNKMSERGHRAASGVSLPENLQRLIATAIAEA